MTWGWVNYQEFFLWMWTNPLTLKRQRIWIREYTIKRYTVSHIYTLCNAARYISSSKVDSWFSCKAIKPKPNDSDKVLGGSEGTSFTCSTASLSQSSLNSAAWNCHNTSVIKDLRKLRLRLISMQLKIFNTFYGLQFVNVNLWSLKCECKTF